MNLVDELHAIAAALRSAGVRYAVCGGVAGALDDSLEVHLPEGPLTIVSRPTLIRMKRMAGRRQDLLDLEQLERGDG